MSKKDNEYLIQQELKYEEILNLLLSDWILAVDLFEKWKIKIRKRFSNNINDVVENFIEEKEFIFYDNLNNQPEYYNYKNA